MNIAKMSSVNFGSHQYHRPGNTTQPEAGNNVPKTPEASYWYQKGFAKAMMVIAMAAPLAAAETSCSSSSEVDPIVEPVKTQVTQTNQDIMNIQKALNIKALTNSDSPTYMDDLHYKLSSTQSWNTDEILYEFKYKSSDAGKTTYTMYQTSDDDPNKTLCEAGTAVATHESDGLHVKYQYIGENTAYEKVFKIVNGKVQVDESENSKAGGVFTSYLLPMDASGSIHVSQADGSASQLQYTEIGSVEK